MLTKEEITAGGEIESQLLSNRRTITPSAGNYKVTSLLFSLIFQGNNQKDEEEVSPGDPVGLLIL